MFRDERDKAIARLTEEKRSYKDQLKVLNEENKQLEHALKRIRKDHAQLKEQLARTVNELKESRKLVTKLKTTKKNTTEKLNQEKHKKINNNPLLNSKEISVPKKVAKNPVEKEKNEQGTQGTDDKTDQFKTTSQAPRILDVLEKYGSTTSRTQHEQSAKKNLNQEIAVPQTRNLDPKNAENHHKSDTQDELKETIKHLKSEISDMKNAFHQSLQANQSIQSDQNEKKEDLGDDKDKETKDTEREEDVSLKEEGNETSHRDGSGQKRSFFPDAVSFKTLQNATEVQALSPRTPMISQQRFLKRALSLKNQTHPHFNPSKPSNREKSEE